MLEDSDPRISKVDGSGVPYHVRLKRVRESTGRSDRDIAALLGVSLQEYYEWETFEGELTVAMSLAEVSKLSSALGICSRLIFDDGEPEASTLSAAQLSAKIKTYIYASGLSITEFENRVGFEIAPALRDSSEILKWNVDCLRFVCKEIGVDLRIALP